MIITPIGGWVGALLCVLMFAPAILGLPFEIHRKLKKWGKGK